MLNQDIERARFNMIAQQIRPWDVSDERVLETLATVPRERFVPDAYKGLAFADIEVPLAHGESMLAPKIEARLLQALNLQKTDKVLEIGTGSGFLTACLARLSATVISYEIHPDLADSARARLDALRVYNCVLNAEDATTAAIATGYDSIAVTGGLLEPRTPWHDLLKVGGRMFAVIGEGPTAQATLITRTSDSQFDSEVLFETELKALHNIKKPEGFVF